MATNGFHTQNNKRGDKHKIVLSLDYFLIYESLNQTRETFEEKILPGVESDHWLIFSPSRSLGPLDQDPFTLKIFSLITLTSKQI